MIRKLHNYFEQRKDFGTVFLRVIVGWAFDLREDG